MVSREHFPFRTRVLLFLLPQNRRSLVTGFSDSRLMALATVLQVCWLFSRLFQLLISTQLRENRSKIPRDWLRSLRERLTLGEDCSRKNSGLGETRFKSLLIIRKMRVRLFGPAALRFPSPALQQPLPLPLLISKAPKRASSRSASLLVHHLLSCLLLPSQRRLLLPLAELQSSPSLMLLLLWILLLILLAFPLAKSLRRGKSSNNSSSSSHALLRSQCTARRWSRLRRGLSPRLLSRLLLVLHRRLLLLPLPPLLIRSQRLLCSPRMTRLICI